MAKTPIFMFLLCPERSEETLQSWLLFKEKYVATPNWCNYFPCRSVAAIGLPHPFRGSGFQKKTSPASSLQQVTLSHCRHSQTFHCSDQVFADFKQHFRIVKMCAGADNRLCALLRFLRFAEIEAVSHKDSRSDEHCFRSQLTN